MDWVHDYHGFAPSPVNPAIERLRFMLDTDTDIPQNLADDLSQFLARVYNIGKGYLIKIDPTGNEFRGVARIDNLASFTIATKQGLVVPVSMGFERETWWMPDTATDLTQLCDASPTEFDVEYEGTVPTQDIIFRFRANANIGTGDITVVNTRNDLEFTLTGVDLSDALYEVRVDCGAYTVRTSVDDGANYVAAPGIISLPAGQVPIMRLEPGTNSMEVTNTGLTDNFDVDISYVPNNA